MRLQQASPDIFTLRPTPALALTLITGLIAGAALGGRHGQPVAAQPVARGEVSDRPAILPTAGRSLPGPFPAEVLAIIDGDTLEARVTVWLGHTVETRVRLRGIDAAELSSECAEEQAMARVSKEALARLTAGGRIFLTDIGRDKYAGRVVASVLDATGANIGHRMLEEGYAIAYDGGRRQPWCEAGPTVTARR